MQEVRKRRLIVRKLKTTLTKLTFKNYRYRQNKWVDSWFIGSLANNCKLKESYVNMTKM